MNLLAICYDKRVIAGLAAVAIMIWLAAPQFILAALPLLILLACPLSMILMMRMMGGHSNTPPVTAADPAMKLAALEGEQARLAGEIERARRAIVVSPTSAEVRQIPEQMPTARS